LDANEDVNFPSSQIIGTDGSISQTIVHIFSIENCVSKYC